ncbi:MAG: triacylglycerol lipase [Acetatifactor sp.]|nr:triacylglycerol lipase [Acetatifactor sp.]
MKSKPFTVIVKFLNILLYTAVIFLSANTYIFYRLWNLAPVILPLFVWVNVAPVFSPLRPVTARLKNCASGWQLLVMFLASSALSICFFVGGCLGLVPPATPLEAPSFWVINSLLAILLEAVVFWNGIIRVYVSSEQLGIKIRAIGIICGMIPIANLVALGIILRTVYREVAFENMRILRNEARKDDKLCATKYPILMVHGVFFRDFRYFNYWGRIPRDLEQNGAKIYYGNHQSAASVADSAQEIADRILQLVKETGCEKVNVIGHSKGGLDTRAALQLPGVAEHVASLTTVSTPHRGCEFADYLLSKVPKREQQRLAKLYNGALRKLGDPNPDFLGSVKDLTATACSEFNERTPDVPGVYYQSVGTKLKTAGSGQFPLNFTYLLARHFSGPNDGLVDETSFPWGENYQFLTAEGSRGISHGDMIDLNRENIPDFDVREFYVQLVHELKEKGF